ncbi:MAG: response regulator [Chromatiales bacterium]
MLQNIESNWPVLPSGIWNSSSLQQLSRHLNDLGRRCEQLGAKEFRQVISEIDMMLNRIIDDNTPPDSRQIDELTRYLDRLRAMADVQRQAEAAATAKPIAGSAIHPFDLLYLCASETETQNFTQAIERHKLHGRILFDPEALQVILVGSGTKTLMIDADFLGSQALEPVLHLLKTHRATGTILFIISDQTTVEARLNALRAGALQLFTKPVDMERVIGTMQTQTNPRPVPRPRVLIVEDDESQASFAIKLLQKGGMETLTITDPLEVIDAVARFQPDLILMDLYMPGADGIELTRVIRDRWDSSAIPVVFLSGEDDLDKKLLALHAGADDFLTKPVRPQQLLATVKTRIQRARQVAEVALKRAGDNAGRMVNRRALLESLDLALTGGGENGGLGALLILCLAAPATTTPWERFEQDQAIDPAFEAAILPLLQEDDLLANLGEQRLALLYRRDDEVALKHLAERLFEALSTLPGSADQPRVGIAMMLLNGARPDTYRQLSRTEKRAESAWRQGLQGFELCEEEAAKVDQAAVGGATPEEKAFQGSLSKGTIQLQKQRYSGRRESATETLELLPVLVSAEEQADPYQEAAKHGAAVEFDRFICQQALQLLSDQIDQGRGARVIFKQSAAVISQPDYLEFLKSELRRRQIVGTGLVVEFELPTLTTNVKGARALIGELSGMGVTVALGNFACNEPAFKMLAFLRAEAIRPHRSLLNINDENIVHIAQQAHSMHVEIILPRISHPGEISLHWTEYADLIQADSSGWV